MEVLYVINSFIHKPGNIGKRIGKIIDQEEREDIQINVISRGGKVKHCKSNITMGILGQVPRIFNAIRIYWINNFKSRLYDLKLFECFFKIASYFLSSNHTFVKVAHVVEFSPAIIRRLRAMGYKVILDVPIGPSHYVERLLVENGSRFGLSSTSYMSKFEEGSFFEADIITVPSTFVRDELLRINIPSEKIRIIPFGVDDVAKVTKKAKEKQGLDFCFAGMINCRKGVEFLLEAWDCDEFKGDRLHLCGRLTPEIAKLLKKKDFKNVILPGFIDTSTYFPKCDIYVFPSLLEGSSKSIYEAMNCGLPVITTIESGSIVADGEDGFIIDRCCSASIRNRMLHFKMNSNQIEIMGLNASKKVASYTWKRYSDSYFNLYHEVAGNINER